MEIPASIVLTVVLLAGNATGDDGSGSRIDRPFGKPSELPSGDGASKQTTTPSASLVASGPLAIPTGCGLTRTWCHDKADKTDELFGYFSAAAGFPGRVSGKKVIIIGAGLSGLTAAAMLYQTGYQVTVLEASNRAGGRVETASDYDYRYELGAMRIPCSGHLFIHHLIRKYSLRAVPFQFEPADFHHYYVRGTSCVKKDLERCMPFLAKEFNISGNIYGDPVKWASDAMKQPLEDLRTMTWDSFLAKYDHLTTYEYLLSFLNNDHNKVDMVGIFYQMEAMMSGGLVDTVVDDCVFNSEFIRLVDGHQLFVDLLMDEFAGGAGDVRIAHRATKVQDRNGVINVTTDCQGSQCPTGSKSLVADRLIITTSAPVTYGIQFEPDLTRAKRVALANLNYLSSSKVFLVFQFPWWGSPVSSNFTGGRTITDLPIKVAYYPTTQPATGLGLLEASYTWGKDSDRQIGQSDEDLITESLESLGKIHGYPTGQLRKWLIRGEVKHWRSDPETLAGFAHLNQHQYKTAYPFVKSPEYNNRVFFAGEHTEVPHAWMDTAIRSGVRAALELHNSVKGASTG